MNDVGLKEATVVPDDSYVIAYNEKVMDMSSGNGDVFHINLYLEGNPFSDPEKVKSLYNHFEVLSNVSGMISSVHWHSSYIMWLKDQNMDPIKDIDDNLGNFFSQSLVEINGTQITPAEYWNDVICVKG